MLKHSSLCYIYLRDGTFWCMLRISQTRNILAYVISYSNISQFKYSSLCFVYLIVETFQSMLHISQN